MLQPKTTVFCSNIGTYKGQLTKRKSYTVEEVNPENVRIKNDQHQLKWYSTFYFELEKQPEIRSITPDDRIENPASGLIEVTIEFVSGEKYWTRFTTPEYVKEILKAQPYINTRNLIIINKLTEERIEKTVLELDEQNELLVSCKAY